MKKFVAMSLTIAGSAALAGPHVPEGEFGQNVAGMYRAVVIDKGGKTAVWMSRECEPESGKCHESRSEKVKVRMASDQIVEVHRSLNRSPADTSAGVPESAPSNWIGFEVVHGGQSLFHPSQGDYVRR